MSGKGILSSALFLLLFISVENQARDCKKAEQEHFISFPGEYENTDQEIPEIQYAPHPRLLFPAGQESEILRKAEKNILLSDLLGALRKEAGKKLELPFQNYTSEGKLLHVSREQISRILTLSMAYRLFREKKYAARVEDELIHVCGFINWSPSHFLDVAEMTTAVAIGYDWCYDYISDKTKQTVEKAILEKAFAPAWPLYEKEGKTPFSRENNWNMVCNSGMVTGALAIGDIHPEMAKRVLGYAVKNTPNLLQAFAPEGVFNEGPGYWSYNGMYMALFFDHLNRIVKKAFGLPDFPGLDHTARYYMEQVAPSKMTFNFGDASEQTDYSATFFNLSKQYNQPEVAVFYRNLIHSALKEYKIKGEFDFPRFFFLSIPWFDDRELTSQTNNQKLTVFKGITDLLIFNGNVRTDDNRFYLISKTGRADWSHNQLDAGSFVIECDGERWGIDMGADSYSLPDFWDYKPGGVRWNYFRNTNMAHNTISIDNKIAYSSGQGEIAAFSLDELHPWGVFDLSPCYPDQASSVKRGFRLLSPTSILVRDEMELPSADHTVSWRFFTRASVKIEKNTAILSQNGKVFYIKCLLPSGFQLKSFPAKPWSPEEKPISNVNVVEIVIHTTGKKCTVPVLLSKNPDEPGIMSMMNGEIKDWN